MATRQAARPGRKPIEADRSRRRASAMKKVYSSDSYFLVGHLRQLLESNHIKCVTKNEYLLGGAGELPPTECWPELWIVEDFQYQKARELVEGFLSTPAGGDTEWSCPECGEHLEGQFTACWRCGANRPFAD